MSFRDGILLVDRCYLRTIPMRQKWTKLTSLCTNQWGADPFFADVTKWDRAKCWIRKLFIANLTYLYDAET